MTRMTNRELWFNGCCDNNTELWVLDMAGNAALYETKNQYECKGNYYYDTPVYHVWAGDKCVVATTNRTEAYDIWETVKKIGEAGT